MIDKKGTQWSMGIRENTDFKASGGYEESTPPCVTRDFLGVKWTPRAV